MHQKVSKRMCQKSLLEKRACCSGFLFKVTAILLDATASCPGTRLFQLTLFINLSFRMIFQTKKINPSQDIISKLVKGSHRKKYHQKFLVKSPFLLDFTITIGGFNPDFTVGKLQNKMNRAEFPEIHPQI